MLSNAAETALYPGCYEGSSNRFGLHAGATPIRNAVRCFLSGAAIRQFSG